MKLKPGMKLKCVVSSPTDRWYTVGKVYQVMKRDPEDRERWFVSDNIDPTGGGSLEGACILIISKINLSLHQIEIYRSGFETFLGGVEGHATQGNERS